MTLESRLSQIAKRRRMDNVESPNGTFIDTTESCICPQCGGVNNSTGELCMIRSLVVKNKKAKDIETVLR